MAVALFTSDSKKIIEADSEQLIEGSETASAIAEAPGAYLIEVRSPEKTAKTGRYEIKVEGLRAATAEDKYRVAGEVIFREAERLQNGTLDDRRKSIEKYHEALELYRRAGARRGEAEILSNIGEVYQLMGEMRKALEKYNEALPISRAVGDRSGEAVTLNNIGSVYWSMGESQKALEKYNEALSLRRAVGDRSGEAQTLSNIGVVHQILGEPQKALETYNEALSLRRAVGDRIGEAVTLNNIGQVYRLLGELQKALETYNEALPITTGVRQPQWGRLTHSTTSAWSITYWERRGRRWRSTTKLCRLRRAVGDRSGEAITLSNVGHGLSHTGRDAEGAGEVQRGSARSFRR